MVRYLAVSAKAAMALGLAAVLLSGCASTGGVQRDAQGGVVLSQEQNALFQSAMAKIGAEQYQEGISLLDQLAASTRQTPVPYINMAMAYEKLDDLDGAEQSLQNALKIEPNNPVANNEYGLLLRKKGQFIEARKTYEKILRKYPNFALANKNLGVLCDIYLRDYSCALSAYQAYSAAVPDDEQAKIWVSDLEMRVK